MQRSNDVNHVMHEWKIECIGTRHFQQKEIFINLQRFKSSSTWHCLHHKRVQFGHIGSQLTLRKTLVVLCGLRMLKSWLSTFPPYQPFLGLLMQLPWIGLPKIECKFSVLIFGFPLIPGCPNLLACVPPFVLSVLPICFEPISAIFLLLQLLFQSLNHRF